MIKLSIVTPSVRIEALELNRQSLSRQTLSKDFFEWIVISPFEYENSDIWTLDPPKNKGDYYALNKAYNAGFKMATGELIISYQDQIELDPTTLERFLYHYEANPKAIIGALGDQYGTNGELVWVDPRRTTKFGSFYECGEEDVEYALCSIPRAAIYEVGGLKSFQWDKYAALSEKEMNVRMYKAGYKFYLDQSINYKAEHHPRLSTDWDERYQAGCVYYRQCMEEIKRGEGLQGDLNANRSLPQR